MRVHLAAGGYCPSRAPASHRRPAASRPTARARVRAPAARCGDARRGRGTVPVARPAGRDRTDAGSPVGKVLRPVPHLDRAAGRLLPGMPVPPAVRRGGRRGRRTAVMVRIARERIADLFALAEREATRGDRRLAGRYVALARRIGMRYNVRLLAEYRELYCRGCSAFWIDGRTVRTRLRLGRRSRTCLVCGRTRRVRIRPPTLRATPAPETLAAAAQDDPVLAPPSGVAEDDGDDGTEPEGE